MEKVSKLIYKGDLVGYRFKYQGKSYDVGISTLYEIGVVIEGVEKEIVLKKVDGLLMSKSEFVSSEIITDITNNYKQVEKIINELH